MNNLEVTILLWLICTIIAIHFAIKRSPNIREFKRDSMKALVFSMLSAALILSYMNSVVPP